MKYDNVEFKIWIEPLVKFHHQGNSQTLLMYQGPIQDKLKHEIWIQIFIKVGKIKHYD